MADFPYWWLIVLPAFFGLGWLAARVDIKHVLAETRSLPAQYFTGLNHLLNGETNRAVEVYVEIARHHAETVELQFTLGHLFRRRGELERAIRMHTRLLARRELAPAQQQAARFELAKDFLKAGLFDRAESLLQALQNTDYARQARRELLAVYQQEKAWQRAIDIAQQLSDDSHGYQQEIAQFYCELAEQAFARSQPERAQAHLEAALQANRQCARARLLAGELAIARGDPAAAINAWLAIEAQDPLVLALVAGKLLAAYDALEQSAQGLQLLQRWLNHYPELDVLDLVYERLLAQHGVDAAYAFVRAQLKAHPTMPSLLKVLEAHLLVAPAEHKYELGIINRLLAEVSLEQTKYYCSHCGFKSSQHFWHCPACSEWETYPPVRGRKSRQPS